MKKVGTFVARDPVTARTDTTVKEAARLLLDEGISCLPVLDAQGGVAGVVTSSDIMRHVAEE